MHGDLLWRRYQIDTKKFAFLCPDSNIYTMLISIAETSGKIYNGIF